MYLVGFLSYIPIVGLMPRDWLRHVTPFVFFLDILRCSTICSHCANILSQFTAPCDALRTWPFCFPTCWSHFINGVLFETYLCPRSWPLSAPGLVWVCQVPAALHNLFLPFPTNQRVRLRSPRHAVWCHPSPWIATHANPSFGLPLMLRLWRLIIHFLAPSTFFLCAYSVGGLVSCMLWYPPHTFLCPEWWSTNERGLKRNLTGTGIKPSPNVNVIFLHHWHSQPPGSPEPRRVSPNCSASKKGVSSRFVMKTPWKMTGNMSSMMCLL